MVIGEIYINESLIAWMCYVFPQSGSPYADIHMTYGSQVQAKCTKHQYTEALKTLKNAPRKNDRLSADKG
jgi:hypothetical protein